MMDLLPPCPRRAVQSDDYVLPRRPCIESKVLGYCVVLFSPHVCMYVAELKNAGHLVACQEDVPKI